MKKLLLLLGTIITLSAKSQTTVYHPFPDSNATWCASECGLQGNALTEATDQLSGKVLINGNWYSKMLHYERSCYGAGACYCAQVNGAYTDTYYIRQDTAQKNVWLYYPPTNSDTIFLDFDLNVGDTIDARKAYWARQLQPWNGAIVSSIDSVLIGSQYRTRYNYTYQSFINSMIEGIGPDHGFFYMANPGVDRWPVLNIFSQNNQLFYPFYSPDTTGMGQSCHNFTTGIEENSSSSWSVFPNPFSDKLNISVTNSTLSEIILYDISSRKLLQQKFTSSVTLNTSQLAKGIYIYEVRNNPDSHRDGVIRKGKVVKE